MSDAIGILHPGQMGASIAAAAASSGREVFWCSAQRSEATRERARSDGLHELGSLDELVERCAVLISVCPPDAANTVADAAVSRGFCGLYVDANAVSPRTARSMGRRVETGGARFVDGGIVGPPARGRSTTVLYLSGEAAHEVAPVFANSELQTHVVGLDIGQASALKMAFAAWTKGSSALLLATCALAEAEGVSDGLSHAWDKLSPGLSERASVTAQRNAPKAWRFAGEMREIASTFEAAGLPAGFHAAATEIYERLAEFKDAPDPVELQAAIARLIGSS